MDKVRPPKFNLDKNMLKKINDLSRPKLLDKLNSKMMKHSRVAVTPDKKSLDRVVNNISLLNQGRNSNDVSLNLKNNHSQNKSYSQPKYIPIHDRFPVIIQQQNKFK